MVIRKRHAELLLKARDEGVKFADVLGDDIHYLDHLDKMGLIELDDEGVFTTTYSGSLLAETIERAPEFGGNPLSDWDDSFRFLGSEIITMLYTAKHVQGRTHKSFNNELEKRGLAQNGNLTPLAYSIIEHYEKAHPKLVISKELAETLRKIPPGPGLTKFLKADKFHLLELESMRLLSFSIPKSEVYSLSGLGQQIRAAIMTSAPAYDVIIDEKILKLFYEGNFKDSPIFNRLVAMAFVSPEGEPLQAGKHLISAAKIYFDGPITVNPSLHLELFDIYTLKAIAELEAEGEKEINDEKIRLRVKKKFELEDFDPKLYLHRLLAVRLIDVDFSETSSIYRLTDWGKEVYEHQKLSEKAVPAHGVKSITLTRMEFTAPEYQWFMNGEKAGLTGNGFPSKAGLTYAKIGSNAEKIPFVENIEMKALKILPLFNGSYIDELESHWKEDKPLLDALSSLDSDGIVDLLPGNAVVLTEAGKLIKRALQSVPDSVQYPIHPLLVKILVKLNDEIEAGNDISTALKKTEKALNVPGDLFEELILFAKRVKYIGARNLTPHGKYIVEAYRKLSEIRKVWEEVMV